MSHPVKQLRKEKGWSMEELARRAGVSYRTVFRIEHEMPVSFNSFRHVLRALGLEVEEYSPVRVDSRAPDE